MRDLTLRYDPSAEAVYIYIGDTEWRTVSRTVELGTDDCANADYDQNGKLLGVEILGVAQPVVHVYDQEHRRSVKTVRPRGERL